MYGLSLVQLDSESIDTSEVGLMKTGDRQYPSKYTTLPLMSRNEDLVKLQPFNLKTCVQSKSWMLVSEMNAGQPLLYMLYQDNQKAYIRLLQWTLSSWFVSFILEKVLCHAPTKNFLGGVKVQSMGYCFFKQFGIPTCTIRMQFPCLFESCPLAIQRGLKMFCRLKKYIRYTLHSESVLKGSNHNDSSLVRFKLSSCLKSRHIEDEIA
ncbi:hypothetical protein IW261DRAFT_1423472 [Armillaria novae-zelandiae]|uniref:Uncharacterized protein n=1 Tax=Armillaria novae-zelandiae TaxID=153914 RepID=A0AA39NY95_9AGAR|nr:hypothetical protein IW261DRAFT_1423472 [Armillaria novae-zelandiae]